MCESFPSCPPGPQALQKFIEMPLDRLARLPSAADLSSLANSIRQNRATKSSFFHLRCPQLSYDISVFFSLPRHVSRSMAACERYDKYSERKWISADLAIRFRRDMAKAQYANAVPKTKSNSKSRRMQVVWEIFTCKQRESSKYPKMYVKPSFKRPKLRPISFSGSRRSR